MIVRKSIALVLVFGALQAGAQDPVAYEIPGISAWNTGKTYGFLFHPEKATGESVSSPLDGYNTRLTRSENIFGVVKTTAIAQMIGGQPSVNAGQRNTTFKFFAGRTLQPGWTVRSVDLGGNFTYVEQPRLNTSDLSFRVRLSPGGTATLRKVVLNGPAGKTWADAFSAPERRDYVINGVAAWNAAKKYGFTFTPVIALSDWSRYTTVTGEPDGIYTALVYPTRTDDCTHPPGLTQYCILGQIAGGNMSVLKRIFPGTSQSVVFELYGAKKLSPGWTVKSVAVSNGQWVKQAQSGANDLLMQLKVTSTFERSAIAIINSITLEGPSSAASYEDAFKNAQER